MIKNEDNKIKGFIALSTAGLFHYIIWTVFTILRRPETDSPIESQIIAFLSVITMATVPILMIVLSFFFNPPANIQNILFAVTIAAVTIFIGIKNEVEVIYFIFILVFNIIQGFGLFTLYLTNEFTLMLFVMIIIQAALLTPSLESFERLELMDLLKNKPSNKLFGKFFKLAKITPLSISQFYRDYIYLLACALLYMTTIIHIRIASGKATETVWTIENVFKTPSYTGFFIFLISLILIVLKKNTTDYKSGWGRNTYVLMKENFNLILSIYSLIALFSIALYRFHTMKNLYFLTNNPETDLMVSHQAFMDLLFVALIFYYFLIMAFELKSNPKYQIQHNYRCFIDHHRGQVQIPYEINNNSSETMECKFIASNAVFFDKKKGKKINCYPGPTRLIVKYDRATVTYPSLNEGYIDITISRRRYKHRLYFSALHTFNILKEKKLTEEDRGRMQNLYVDQAVIYKKFSFRFDGALMTKAHVGFLNTTKNDIKISVLNVDELKDRSIEVFLLNKDNQPCDELMISGETHIPNCAEVIFNYNNLEKELENNFLITSIEFQLNDFETLTLPYIVEIEPMIYNDTDSNITLTYPEGSISNVSSNSLEYCKATNIPVKLKYEKTNENYETYITLKPGLTLLSSYAQNFVKKSSGLKGFHAEVALVGLSRSGKTTYLTTLNKESLKHGNDIPLIPIFNDKRLRTIMDTYMENLRNSTFPASTSIHQFDSFHFQVLKGNVKLTVTVKDIAGEYFSSEFSDQQDDIQENAKKYFDQSDYVFITIDTNPVNFTSYDTNNQILLDNISRKNQNYDSNKIRILFTKVDKSEVSESNIKNWLYDKLPKTANIIYTTMDLHQDSFYFVSIGNVDNNDKILSYNPKNIIKPISDILLNADKKVEVKNKKDMDNNKINNPLVKASKKDRELCRNCGKKLVNRKTKKGKKVKVCPDYPNCKEIIYL